MKIELSEESGSSFVEGFIRLVSTGETSSAAVLISVSFMSYDGK
ncbi:hypothetical protein [Bacillus massilinigeriensis]|nr:hypothetical protein [Bacillus mediterraneensis]